MGSEHVTPSLVYVTGFKPFEGVSMNPTEFIVNALPTYLSSADLSGISLGGCRVLETVGLAQLEDLRALLDSPFDKTSANHISSSENNSIDTENQNSYSSVELKDEDLLNPQPMHVAKHVAGNVIENIPRPNFIIKTEELFSNKRVFWLHLGINASAEKFMIEKRAVNEATFRCPDESGWKPKRELIVCEDLSISHHRETDLPVESLASQLCKKGFKVDVSHDAGRYVCNYVYYQSLYQSERHPECHVLFVHVPPFHVIDHSTQLRFVSCLIQCLALC